MPNLPENPNDPPNPPDVTVESVFGAQAGNPPILPADEPSDAEVEIAADPSEVPEASKLPSGPDPAVGQ